MTGKGLKKITAKLPPTSKRMKLPRAVLEKSVLEGRDVQDILEEDGDAIREVMMAASLVEAGHDYEAPQGEQVVEAPQEEDHQGDGVQEELEDAPLEEGEVPVQKPGAKLPEQEQAPNQEPSLVFRTPPSKWPQPLRQVELSQSDQPLTEGRFTEALRMVMQEVMGMKAQEPKSMLRAKMIDPWGPGKREYGELRHFLSNLDGFMALYPHEPEAIKVQVAATLLRGDAVSMWAQHSDDLRSQGKEITLGEFKTTLLSHYSEVHASDIAVSKLFELQEKEGRYREYRDSFEALRTQLPRDEKAQNELFLVTLFKRGLSRDTASRVMVDPTSGLRHRNLRKLQEHAQASSEMRGPARKGELPPRGDRGEGPSKKQRLQKGPNRFKKQAPRMTPRMVKGMTPMELREKGLCLLCGEEGHMARACPTKKAPFKKQLEN
jgi:hypothetical protein